MIETREATLAYQDHGREVFACERIDLRVEPNEFLGILGPSGSGKSSLLYLLSGLKSPTSGSVLYEGRDLNSMPDTERSQLRLREFGFERASSILEAQVILLNTCSVRKKPEDKAFSMLGELEPLKRSRADVIIGVCGCMAQVRADEIRRRAPHVDFVVGTGQIAQIPAMVEEAAQSRKFRKRLDLPERKGAVVDDVPDRHVGRTPKLKAFVPIQYGCDKFCSFCIVPTTRGRERSRPTDDIVEEVRRLAAQGTREVTLLGQTVNSYGKNLVEGRVPFSALLDRVSEVDGLLRIRYTSPYPRDFRTDLIEVIRGAKASGLLCVRQQHEIRNRTDLDLLFVLLPHHAAAEF